MKFTAKFVVLLSLLLAASLGIAQDSDKDKKADQKSSETLQTTHGWVEFGGRAIFGDVYGRPDLPFEPALKTSKLNEYRDLRNGFFVRNARIDMEDFLGTNNYLSIQAQRAVYRDQGYLVSFGSWGKYKLQFRYDQIPHVYSNTTRTIFTKTAAGRLEVPGALRTQLQTLAAQTTGCPAGTATGCNLPLTLETQVEPQMSFFVPQIDRRAGMFNVDYNFTPDWNVFASYRREHESGSRPLGQIINSSPSASLTGGFGAEIPEPIDYYTDDVRIGTEFGRQRWGLVLGYLGSYFSNNVGTVLFDNPFRTTDCISGGTAPCTSATQGPATALVDLFPSNRADYFNVAGSFNLAPHTNFMASITPGWLRQNDPFVPYTSNALRLAQTGPLPAASLNGEKQTLAMTYTLASHMWRNFEFKAQYRHYDYNNNTPDLFFSGVQGDIAAPGGPVENRKPSFNRKNFEATGAFIFWKDSSVKVGYNAEWMDRQHRDVDHSMEHGVVGTIDLKPGNIFSFNASYRYAKRNPEHYDDELSDEISGGMPVDQPNSRRFDEAPRVRNRFDASLGIDATDKLSFTVFASGTHDDYNRSGGVNTTTPLNFVPGNYIPYYAYGLLKDLSWFWGADANFVVNDKASFFAEYSFERYYRSMTSRNRTPGSASAVLVPQNCGVSTSPCDSPNNDWASAARDKVHVGTLGFDLKPWKRTSWSSYYSLSAGTGLVTTRPLGDVTLTATGAANPHRFFLTGTNAATDYPMTVSRQHELGTIIKFKLSEMIQPKFEYRFNQWDNKDYQTTPTTPYMGCFSSIPNGPPVTNAVPGCTTPIILTNTFNPAGSPSVFYPYNVVGDPSAARYLFLGVDQPSFRSHYIAATLEFHF